MENDIHKLQKQYAALAFALGVARGALSEVMTPRLPPVLPRASVCVRMHWMFTGTSICQTQKSTGFRDMTPPNTYHARAANSSRAFRLRVAGDLRLAPALH